MKLGARVNALCDRYQWVFWLIVAAVALLFAANVVVVSAQVRALDAANMPKPIPAAPVTVTPQPHMEVERIETTSNGAKVVRVRTDDGVVGISTVVRPGDRLTITRPPAATPSATPTAKPSPSPTRQ